MLNNKRIIKRKKRLLSISMVLILTLTIELMTPIFCTNTFAEPTTENPTAADDTANGEETKIDTSWPAGPEIFAECGVLIEASSGTVLYDKNANQQMYPASITKIMTTMLGLEYGTLSDMVEFSHHAVYSIETGAAHISRDQGELLSLNDCLYAVMLASANEAANAVGEYVAKKQPAYTQKISELQAAGTDYDESLVAMEIFSNMMNERALQCGALNTHFTNPHGLFDENHWTTCYDMAMITREAIKNEQFLKIEGQTSYIIPTTNLKSEPLPISNRHKMVFPLNAVYYEGILGGKTGYVDQSGNTLVTFARRNGMTLISVVMRSDSANVYNDTKLLLDYGFEKFYLTNIAANEKDFTPASHSILGGNSSIFTSSQPLLRMDSDANVVLPNNVPISCCTKSVTYSEDSSDVFASLQYKLNDRLVGSADLMIHNPEDDEHKFDFDMMVEEETTTTEKDETYITISIWPIVIFLIVLVVVALIAYYIYFNQPIKVRRRKRRRSRRSRNNDDYIIRDNSSKFSKKRKR